VGMMTRLYIYLWYSASHLTLPSAGRCGLISWNGNKTTNASCSAKLFGDKLLDIKEIEVHRDNICRGQNIAYINVV